MASQRPSAGKSDELSRLVGETLDGKYRLDGVIGRGGMGVVYQATHLGTRRIVALKVVAPGFLSAAEFVERFRREAEAAGRLRHPNVVDVTDFGFGEVDGQRLAYLVMEYLDGCPLDEVLQQEGRLPLRWVADIVEQVCSAVEEAHRHGIVHRDLKPSNLWLEPDRRGGYRVKVLDFGLAKLAEPSAAALVPPASTPVEVATPSPLLTQPSPAVGGDEAETLARPAPTASRPAGDSTPSPGLTQVGATLGTPLYMAPEQCRGEPADARSDVYSLGVIAYQMLAGRPPFSGNATELMRQHLASAPPPLDVAVVPRAVAALVMAALAKDPAARPARATAFGTAFVARCEGAGTVLRQILTLFADHARVFLLVAAGALAPCMVWAAFGMWVFSLELTLDQSVAVSVPTFLCGLLLFIGGLLGASAVFQPIVAQLLAMPLRPLVLRPLFEALRQRFATFARLLGWFFFGYLRWTVFPALAAGLLVLATMPLVPVAKRGFLIIGLFGVSWLCSAVWLLRLQDSLGFAGAGILMEGLAGEAARERSRSLARSAKRDVTGFEGVRATILLSVAGGGALAARLLLDGTSETAAPIRLAAGLAFVGLAIAGMAIALTAGALLYFKARQAAGEPLAEALERFERDSLPAGYWQQRVRDRIRFQVESGR